MIQNIKCSTEFAVMISTQLDQIVHKRNVSFKLYYEVVDVVDKQICGLKKIKEFKKLNL